MRSSLQRRGSNELFPGIQGCKLLLLDAFLLFNHYSFDDRTMQLYVQIVVIFLAGLLLSLASGGTVVSIEFA